MKKIDTSKYVEMGYNKAQATSLAWADHFADWMDSKSASGSGSLFGPEIRIDTYCVDCNKGGQFLPSTARDFIHMHKDHKTKTMKLR